MFGGAGGASGGSTPTTRVSVTSDDHSNSLIVSAPEDLMALVEEVVKQVDVAVQDVTMVKVFKLKNADAGEMADLLTNLFPDDTNPNGASSQQFQFPFGGFGQRGGAAGRGGTAGRGTSAASSDRMQKLGRVVAVPDRRTASIVVSASNVLMPEIEKMIKDLDLNPAKKMKVFAVNLENADPQDVMQILQDLIPANTSSGSRSSTTSTQTSPLVNRSTT